MSDYDDDQSTDYWVIPGPTADEYVTVLDHDEEMKSIESEIMVTFRAGEYMIMVYDDGRIFFDNNNSSSSNIVPLAFTPTGHRIKFSYDTTYHHYSYEIDNGNTFVFITSGYIVWLHKTDEGIRFYQRMSCIALDDYLIRDLINIVCEYIDETCYGSSTA